MARFFPTLDHAEFRSEGEFTLFRELAVLDDGFVVIHSLPWLRGRTKRVYSQELREYLRVSLDRKHLSGEVDFVILHSKLGMLCIETKSGLYKPSGIRFIHERDGYEIDPLNQVQDNTFVLIEMLALHGKVDQQYAVLIVDEAQALNEADHLALRDHFANARKFVFADELQVLPGIEKGSSYRFLEETYDERFFYLATVYRNPGRITQVMMEMRPPRHEVNCPRPNSKDDLSRRISRDVSKSIQALTAELSKAGVMTQDMIVLSQFSLSLEGTDASRSTISAYRGMEKPVVIVVAGLDMDDITLACALGRATTSAYIIVPIELLACLSRLKSDFLRKGLEKIDLSSVLDQDARDPTPRFIINKVQKFAGAIGRHVIFGEGFFYASRWRRWVYEGGAQWANRGVQLWGWWLSLSTNLPISGIDRVRNELTDCYLLSCAKCGTTTPHDRFDICLTCLASPLDEAETSAIALHAAELDVVRSSTRGQSLIKVAALVGDFQFPRFNEAVRGITEVPVLELATTIIEFWMRRNAIVATKSQIEQRLREVLVASELDDSIAAVAGRTISSLCGKKILVKIDTGRYRLTDTQ